MERLTELAKIEEGYATPASLQLPMCSPSLNRPFLDLVIPLSTKQ